MHEAPSTNGHDVAMHEAGALSDVERLRTKVASVTAEYDQVRAEHADAKREQRDAEAKRRKLVDEQKKANAAHASARERRDAAKAELDVVISAASDRAAAATVLEREVLRRLRKAERTLAIEESDRTPRAVRS
jgi:chromosome segregation ATPase